MPSDRLTGAAWIFLVAATLLTFWMTAALDTQLTVIGAGMLLAVAKVYVVLRIFMGSNHLSVGLKTFVYAWAIGCGAMIWGVAWLTP